MDDHIDGGGRSEHSPSAYTLHVGLARVEEQLKSVVRRVEHHMIDEHREFKQALEKITSIDERLDEQDGEMSKQVNALEKKIDALYTGAKVTRVLAGIAATLATWVFWLKDHIFHIGGK